METTSFKQFRIIAPIAVLVAAVLGLSAFAVIESEARSPRADDHIENSDSAITFRNDMRKLWEDHVVWTRLAIISLADDLPDQEATVGRLLQNQDDIGSAVATFYGDEAGDALTVLLREHIVVAADLVLAAKAGDTDAVNANSELWYRNGDEIAAFLNSANPEQWPLEHMQDMMREHLDLTLAEAQARLAGDYATDVAAYDQVHDAILEMADMLSLGIINQFPKHFK